MILQLKARLSESGTAPSGPSKSSAAELLRMAMGADNKTNYRALEEELRMGTNECDRNESVSQTIIKMNLHYEFALGIPKVSRAWGRDTSRLSSRISGTSALDAAKTK